MKIRVEKTTKPTPHGNLFGILTKCCPYPRASSLIKPPMVGSFACHQCEQCKSWTDGFVYCKAGDRQRTKQEVAA